jgi:hypothetical protein
MRKIILEPCNFKVKMDNRDYLVGSFYKWENFEDQNRNFKELGMA